MIYVLYHSNCYDGFGAAYCAWKKFGDEARYIPVSYGKPPPEMPSATEIYILDFSYDAEEILKLADKARVIVLDHHKTAEEKLKPLLYSRDNPKIIFDMSKSGALITWDYFFGDGFKEAPALIRHISDRDLWTFQMAGSKEIHSALVSYPFDFYVWDKFDVEKLKEEGVTCERFEKSVVDKICKSAFMRQIDTYTVPVVNTTQSWSEVGHELLQRYPDAPFVASFTIFEDQIMWSLRSRIGFDVSTIAKKFGGGGHAQAAGFKSVRP
ncbi:phosphohydrolase [Candidatus Dependentiae bacterium]|nr:MAG: phosphohydrolase [Candidatus Dependentiae bacterium]